MINDYIQCTKCGRLEHGYLIDGKDDGTGDYNLLECIACYGPGWGPCGGPKDFELSNCPDLTPLYAKWENEEAERLIESMAGDSAEVQVNKVCDAVAMHNDYVLTRAFGQWACDIIKRIGANEFTAIIKRRPHEAPRF